MSTTVLARVQDPDSHEMIPFSLWGETFGEAAGKMLIPLFQEGSVFYARRDSPMSPDLLIEDIAEIDPATIWKVKGANAPGAIDLPRRLLALDAMGIDRQLLFPTMGLIALQLATGSPETIELIWNVKLPTDFDQRAVGLAMIREHNDWVQRNMKELGGDRIRPVAIILTDKIDEMIVEAERVIAGGAKAIFIASSVLPGGRSPADRALDPFWRLAEEANVPVTLHVGGDLGFSMKWGDIPEFNTRTESIEFPSLSPYLGCSFHYASENFLQSIILGGVFERHPQLRFGVIEIGGVWAGPLAERMDTWCEVYAGRAARTMSMRPSEYLARNVRVTPFYFEDVAKYVTRWPELADVYCFSSDYPHVEGGDDPKGDHFKCLQPLGEEILEKFFVKNAEWLLP